jgi:hypothetical protein
MNVNNFFLCLLINIIELYKMHGTHCIKKCHIFTSNRQEVSTLHLIVNRPRGLNTQLLTESYCSWLRTLSVICFTYIEVLIVLPALELAWVCKKISFYKKNILDWEKRLMETYNYSLATFSDTARYCSWVDALLLGFSCQTSHCCRPGRFLYESNHFAARCGNIVYLA